VVVVPERDERPAEQRQVGEEELTYTDTREKQGEFEELVREEEREGDKPSEAFQDAAERDQAGDKPKQTPPTTKP
jgi:hypothetical protein